MKNIIFFLLATLGFVSCNTTEGPKSWQLNKTIHMDGVNPIGIAQSDDGLIWLSDGDHNRLVAMDLVGNIVKTIDSLERPMHIATNGNSVLVPEYGKDAVTIHLGADSSALKLTDSLDAPAGISVWKNERAIADFYNNRILYTKDGANWISFGKEGKAEGDFYYPTDVQITEDKIWVADAYNNRIQVFDKEGAFLKIIGADQKMNAATGVLVSEGQVFVTDFENDRVLVFDHDGNLIQELADHNEKPTDMLLVEKQLYVINYRSGHVNVYDWKLALEEMHEEHYEEEKEHSDAHSDHSE